jgi:hypothetical protein
LKRIELWSYPENENAIKKYVQMLNESKE